MTQLLLICLLFSNPLPEGETVAQNVYQRDEGVTRIANLKMVLRNKRGQERVRDVKVYRKYFGKEKRSVLFFHGPKKLKDTGFLTHDFPEADKEDDQWLYLPALKKVRRISASDRGDYFLGTDFTYDDMKNESRINPEDFDSKTLREEVVDGHKTFVIEEIPVSDAIAKELGASKRLVWVDAERWIPRRIETWDIKGNPKRTVTMHEIKEVQGIWTTHRIEAKNHKTKHATSFIFSDITYNEELSDNTFAKNTLRRGL